MFPATRASSVGERDATAPKSECFDDEKWKHQSRLITETLLQLLC